MPAFEDALGTVPDPTDGRASLVVITEPGREAIEAEWTEHLGERRMAELRRTLTKLREISDPWR